MDQDQTTQTPDAPVAPNLSLQDLIATVNLIQIVTKRGAIQADEMTVVGALYERLVGFLKASGALQPQAATADDATPAADTPTGE